MARNCTTLVSSGIPHYTIGRLAPCVARVGPVHGVRPALADVGMSDEEPDTRM